MTTTLILIASLALIVINVMASIYIWKAPAYESSQKVVQIIFIWLVPYFGAFFFSGFLWFERKETKKVNRKIGNDSNITNSEAVDQAVSTGHYGND